MVIGKVVVEKHVFLKIFSMMGKLTVHTKAVKMRVVVVHQSQYSIVTILAAQLLGPKLWLQQLPAWLP